MLDFTDSFNIIPAGSVFEEDISFLRRRVKQAGKCYCLLLLATMCWLFLPDTLKFPSNPFPSLNFNGPFPQFAFSLNPMNLNSKTSPIIEHQSRIFKATPPLSALRKRTKKNRQKIPS
ncbi:hypothetical protein O181_099037 [Austropuccinia psidii MF-1]|uniref:Uncharacterized protein n=1 Tax=Austropuccinia psidii MF-1 TaxID=1389203 RepID=A0A9Q3JCG7_9BASI|nr:hypothetical protein [Austropuccinia psidii MF-1]